MKECCIGIGDFSSLYFYVIYCFISKLIGNFLLSFSSIIKNSNSGLFYYKSQLSFHKDIQEIYNYIGFIIFGAFFYKCFKKNSKIKQKQNNNNLLTKKLIYNDDEDELYIEDSRFKLLIICFIFIVHNKIIELIFSFDFPELDFWIFNIVFTLIFLSRYYQIKQYKHQLFSMIFVIIINFILSIISSFIPRNEDDKKDVYEKVEDLLKHKLLAIPIIFISIIASCLISYARVEAKVIMEKKYLSPYKLIILIGCLGVILMAISLVFSSIFICNEKIKRMCNVSETENEKYYESVPIYLNELKKLEPDHFWVEILLITPFFSFMNFMKLIFELLMIYYLNPIYILISDAFYYLLIYVLSYILSDKSKSMPTNKFIIIIAMNSVAILGYLIYLEIIELRFCGLTNNIKKSINKRGRIESDIIEIGLVNEQMDNEESFEGENGSERTGTDKTDRSAF